VLGAREGIQRLQVEARAETPALLGDQEQGADEEGLIRRDPRDGLLLSKRSHLVVEEVGELLVEVGVVVLETSRHLVDPWDPKPVFQERAQEGG
jgi:hypothetical protein